MVGEKCSYVHLLFQGNKRDTYTFHFHDSEDVTRHEHSQRDREDQDKRQGK